jgi:hypothetical protein
MFVAGHCGPLMTVGWAWLGSRVCLAKKYWQRVLFIFFFIYLKHKIRKVLKSYHFPDTLDYNNYF